MLLRELEPEKYWSMPSTYSREKRELEIQKMINSGMYYYQLKTDGNYCAFICDFDGDKRLISRGVSKVSGEYGRLEDKVFFYESIAAIFNKPTRIMGEIYFDHGVDKQVGSVLRCGELKAKSIQDNDYYINAAATTKFSAKDKRDIEGNEFRNQKLKLRIFDVWYYDGLDLMNTPWIERQEYVKKATERINHPLVSYVPYYKMDENFYDAFGALLANGEEGVVCYNENGLPEPAKRTAHKTCKLKQEIANDVDAFIIGTEPAVRSYTGKDVSTWQYWEDLRTGEKLIGDYYGDFHLGHTIEPITKGYYFNYPGAILVGVYDNKGEIYPLCKVAGLTDEFKTELRDNFEEWYMCPVSITGMALSDSNGLSIRHPKLRSIRREDINPADCTLAKILD